MVEGVLRENNENLSLYDERYRIAVLKGYIDTMEEYNHSKGTTLITDSLPWVNQN